MSLETYFSNKELYVFEQLPAQVTDSLSPFAYTDLLTKAAGIRQQPMLHFWETHKTVILGMKDTRLPHLPAALDVLERNGYRYVARNSGGLAVVADEGILNLSLIIPLPAQKISIPEAYELMLQVIQLTFATSAVTIEAKEIADSYCPGDYDLSIAGRKFAGIAQRRIREGIAVMIYLSINGPQEERGRLIRDFYRAGLKESFGQLGYPPVRSASMANLSDLLAQPLSVDAVKQRITTLFHERFHNQIKSEPLDEFITNNQLTLELDKNIEKMRRRNADIIQIGADPS